MIVRRAGFERPKVFISYSWGSEEYQNKVLNFASQLIGDGIEVFFDKWDLREGGDSYAYMKNNILDPSTTNILILIDPTYAEKADDNASGVGIETQIITSLSEDIQHKVIPVVMQRDEEGRVCKPTYLQTRLHFDLSDPEEYNSTYRRLVKYLYGEYGEKDYKKPGWIETPDFTIPDVKKLKALGDKWANEPDIVWWLAKGLVSLSSKQEGSTARQETVDKLKIISEIWSEDSSFARMYAEGLFNLSSEQEDVSDRQKTIAELTVLSKAWPNDIEIMLWYEKGLQNLTTERSMYHKMKFEEASNGNELITVLKIMADQMHNEPQRQKAYVYHYTTIKAVEGILKSKQWYLNSPTNMNDGLELRFLEKMKVQNLFFSSFLMEVNISPAERHCSA